MNKTLLNDYQLLELENAELRNRIKELTPKHPRHRFFLEATITPSGFTSYVIKNESGGFEANIDVDTDEEAKQIFNKFKKSYKFHKEVIKAGCTEGKYHSLSKYTITTLVNNTIVENPRYFVSVGHDSIYNMGCDEITEEDMVKKYEEIIKDKFENKVEASATLKFRIN